jgi:hypothetical protein
VDCSSEPRGLLPRGSSTLVLVAIRVPRLLVVSRLSRAVVSIPLALATRRAMTVVVARLPVHVPAVPVEASGVRERARAQEQARER